MARARCQQRGRVDRCSGIIVLHAGFRLTLIGPARHANRGEYRSGVSAQYPRASMNSSARWPEDFLSDLRYGLRQLVRNPLVSAVCVLALALGIGANAAIFSAIHAVLLRPLPFKDS